MLYFRESTPQTRVSSDLFLRSGNGALIPARFCIEERVEAHESRAKYTSETRLQPFKGGDRYGSGDDRGDNPLNVSVTAHMARGSDQDGSFTVKL